MLAMQDLALGQIEQNARTRARQLCTVLQSLGPSFVKIGQALSSRPDLLPQIYLDVSAKISFSNIAADPESMLGLLSLLGLRTLCSRALLLPFRLHTCQGLRHIHGSIPVHALHAVIAMANKADMLSHAAQRVVRSCV